MSRAVGETASRRWVKDALPSRLAFQSRGKGNRSSMKRRCHVVYLYHRASLAAQRIMGSPPVIMETRYAVDFAEEARCFFWILIVKKKKNGGSLDSYRQTSPCFEWRQLLAVPSCISVLSSIGMNKEESFANRSQGREGGDHVPQIQKMSILH